MTRASSVTNEDRVTRSDGAREPGIADPNERAALLARFGPIQADYNNLRADIQRVEQEGAANNNTDIGNSTSGGSEALNMQDQNDAASKVIMIANAKKPLEAELDNKEKQMTDTMTRLGNNTTSVSPPGNEGNALAPDNNIQETQEDSAGAGVNNNPNNPAQASAGEQQSIGGDEDETAASVGNPQAPTGTNTQVIQGQNIENNDDASVKPEGVNVNLDTQRLRAKESEEAQEEDLQRRLQA